MEYPLRRGRRPPLLDCPGHPRARAAPGHLPRPKHATRNRRPADWFQLRALRLASRISCDSAGSAAATARESTNAPTISLYVLTASWRATPDFPRPP